MTTTPTLSAWARRRAVRTTALVAVLAGPVAAVPFLMSGAAVAAPGSALAPAAPQASVVAAAPRATVDCFNGNGAFDVVSSDLKAGTATVKLLSNGCDGQQVALASYETPGTSPGGDALYPQTRLDYMTVTLSGDEPKTLTVKVPPCNAQIDLIAGVNHDGSIKEIYETLTGPQYSSDKALVNHADFVNPACVPTTTTPPTTTTTTTPPPTTTTPPATTTTTTTTTTPPATTTTPPVTTTTPPATTTTPPVTTTTPPATTTSVLASSTSRPPTTTSTSPSSTSVLPFSTSKAPSSSTAVLPFATTAPPAGPNALPYTGSNLPVRNGVLSGFALLSLGGGLVLFAGRTRRRGGSYRAH